LRCGVVLLLLLLTLLIKIEAIVTPEK